MEDRASAELLSAADFDWMSDSTGAWYNLIGRTWQVSASLQSRIGECDWVDYPDGGASSG